MKREHLKAEWRILDRDRVDLEAVLRAFEADGVKVAPLRTIAGLRPVSVGQFL